MNLKENNSFERFLIEIVGGIWGLIVVNIFFTPWGLITQIVSLIIFIIISFIVFQKVLFTMEEELYDFTAGILVGLAVTYLDIVPLPISIFPDLTVSLIFFVILIVVFGLLLLPSLERIFKK